MTNKTRVSKEVFQLLKRVEEEDGVERLVSAVADKTPYLYREYEEAIHLDLQELMRALVNGYEIEKTPKERGRYHMQRITTEQLEAIRKRTEAATAGPWNFRGQGNTLIGRGARFGYVLRAVKVDVDAEIDIGLEDSDFIAKSREDIPALLAEVERLEEILNDAYGEIRRGKNGRAIDIIEEWGDSN